MLLGLYGTSALKIAAEMKVLLGAWQGTGDAGATLLARAHRLRGDSTTAELHSTVELLRAFETVLRAICSGEIAATPARGALLEAAIDRVADVAARAVDGECEEPGEHKELIERLSLALTAS